MKKDSIPLMVTVRCITYNHAPYIRQCLDGFVMQKTNFQFEVVVHDDASTDGTADIVMEYAEKYPQIIRPIFEKENQYSIGGFYLINTIMEEKYPCGKYIAECEGDDYWTDPSKLQLQVDFLENNPDYSMCFHSVNYLENGIIINNDKRSDIPCDFTAKKIIHEGGLFCATCSLLFRSKFNLEMPEFRRLAIEGGVGDSPLQVLLSLRGKVHYFPQIMGCYRYGSQGSWTYEINSNKIKRIKHLMSGIAWYKELDEYTKYQYKDAVYYRICLASLSLYRMGQITRQELFDNFSFLSFGKEKIHFILSWLLIEIPMLKTIKEIIAKCIKTFIAMICVQK